MPHLRALPLRRAVLAVAAAALVAAAVAPLPAGADQTTVTGSWYSATQPDPLPPPIGTPVTTPAPDVPSGDFVVAARPAPQPADQSVRETYLHVDLSAVASGAQLNGLRLTLKEDAAGANVNQAAAVIEAHLVTDFFADGATGAPYSQRPKYDTGAVKGARAADGSWVFDLGSLVNGKTTTELQGVALIPAPAAPTDGFQVVWSGQGTAAPVATFTATAPSGSDATANGGFASAPAGSSPDSFSSEPSSVTPAESFGSSNSFLAVPSTPSVATPPAATPPKAAAPPTTTPRPAPTTRRTAAVHSEHGLSWLFLPAAVGVLVLLGAAAVSLGQAGEPVPPREGAVVRRLERPADVPA